MNRYSLYFSAPHRVEVVQEQLPPPSPHQVQVNTILSAISPGTETMVYRGKFPHGEALDPTLPSLSGKFEYPFQYGYSAVGQVIETGEMVAQSWLGKTVFAFEPHSSHFNSSVDNLIVVPDGVTAEQAVFLPNMETAVNLVMDGAPLIGEDVLVLGQGLVGLLTTALLGLFPLNKMITLDHYPRRRQFSLAMGATVSFDPKKSDDIEKIKGLIPDGVDLCYEITGNPHALNQAIAFTRYSGRVVIGSWYGQKTAKLELGSHFHRNRIRLTSSQVSTLAPQLTGRWDKNRRFQLAWQNISKLDPSKMITHRYHLQQAHQAYRLLDERPEDILGVVIGYA